MIMVTNTIRVKKGHGESVAERFTGSKGVAESPGFVRMEVLFTEGLEDHDELKVCTTWATKAAFEAWVNSDSFRQAHAHRGKKTEGEGEAKESVLLGSEMTTYRVLVTK
ncbi:antibiotic biosynthesis monooxygenase [Paenibacillus sp. NPDC058071]|uniref:antibiotic biosynthesis monooxygenase n=1 Tax=Paenibacillus sp. NPDC058071 TaxID=3346326 RepID=UPI0036D9C1CB